MRIINGGAAAAGVLAAGLALAACHGTSPAASPATAEAASAVASAEANPTLSAAASQALADVQNCAQTTEGLDVTLPAPGSGQTVAVTHVRLRVLAHPVRALEAIIRCTPAGKQDGKAAKKCAEQVAAAGGAGKGVLARDLDSIATRCVAGTPAAPSASPSASASPAS